MASITSIHVAGTQEPSFLILTDFDLFLQLEIFGGTVWGWRLLYCSFCKQLSLATRMVIDEEQNMYCKACAPAASAKLSTLPVQEVTQEWIEHLLPLPFSVFEKQLIAINFLHVLTELVLFYEQAMREQNPRVYDHLRDLAATYTSYPLH